MQILFALPGLHRVQRGAEVAFEAVAEEIARRGRHRVILAGSGEALEGKSYVFKHVAAANRIRFENWPKLPFLRSEFMYEDLTFAANLARKGLFGADLTVTCSFPYSNWALRSRGLFGRRPAHVFVTQNGDWPAARATGEARWFGCDGLVCTNPIYFERNKARWPSVLIPNGIDPTRFQPGPDKRAALGLPKQGKVVLMVSALEPGKRVLQAIEALALVDGVHLYVAGDGPLRGEVDSLAYKLLPGRFHRTTLSREQMPDLYQSVDLFLHTKIEESFGNVYIEALSSGVPIVAHDDQVTRWILGNHAALVDTTSVDLLAETIRGVLDVGKRGNSDNFARAHERFAWSVVARQYEEFFEAVLKRHHRCQ